VITGGQGDVIDKGADMTVMTAPLRDSAVTVRVINDLDVASLQQFWLDLEAARLGHPATLLVDLSGCHELDAQAIRLLLDEKHLMRRDQGQLVLVDCGPEVTRLLSMAGVLHEFALEKS
jgi:anti-anti-sigma factor